MKEKMNVIRFKIKYSALSVAEKIVGRLSIMTCKFSTMTRSRRIKKLSHILYEVSDMFLFKSAELMEKERGRKGERQAWEIDDYELDRYGWMMGDH